MITNFDISSNNLITLPKNAIRTIFEQDAMMTVPLLKKRQFLDYCEKRELKVTPQRLTRFEQLGIFRPIIRMFEKANTKFPLELPSTDYGKWLDSGVIIDSYDLGLKYEVPKHSDESSEAFYSIFQIDDLHIILSRFTYNIELDQYVGMDITETDLSNRLSHIIAEVNHDIQSSKNLQFRRALSVLCQTISNRYYYETQSNGRFLWANLYPGYFNRFPFSGKRDWDWFEHVNNFDPLDVEKNFDLTPSKLNHAYNALSIIANACDPLREWTNLVEFISYDKKRKLSGKALLALSLRDAAKMLKLLYADLYHKNLPPTHEVSKQVYIHFPELSARKDPRRHLELVVNQYDLNPQPKLVLFVEGKSEKVLIMKIFKFYYKSHPGKFGIEINNLQGVNNFTGDGSADRFTAIFRLVDYLHHHQTIAFLILDNENTAKKLVDEAKKKRPSLYGQQRTYIPANHIVLWEKSLEFDNFSDIEIAHALGLAAKGLATFTPDEVKEARHDKFCGNALSKLFHKNANYDLVKPRLSKHLAKMLLDPKSERPIDERPIVKILQQVRELAFLNPLPTLEESWQYNQTAEWLGGNSSAQA